MERGVEEEVRLSLKGNSRIRGPLGLQEVTTYLDERVELHKGL